MAESKGIQDFTTGNVTGKMLRFAAPLFVSNLLQIIYNTADMVIVSHAAGKAGLSAVSVGGDITNFLTYLAMGFCNAASVVISQYIGAGWNKKLGKLIGSFFSFLAVCSLSLSIVCLFVRVPILNLMNCPPESFDQALKYASTCMAGLIFIYGYNATSAVFRGMGDSKHPFMFISISALMNIVLDVVLVIFLHMGAFGAAIATVFSQAFSFIISSIYLMKHFGDYGIDVHQKGFFRIEGEMLAPLVKLGIPMALKSAAIQFSKVFMNSWINSYGVTVSAMAGIAAKVANISNLFSNCVNTAGSAMVGQNIGAEKYDRVPRIMLTAFTVTLVCNCFLIFFLVFYPNLFFGIFTSDPDVLLIAMEYRPICIVVLLGSAFRALMNSFMNGSGNYKINFVIAILDGLVIRICCGLFFGLVLGLAYRGFWWGDAVAGFTPVWIGGIYYLSGKWKTRKYIIKEG